MNDVPQFITTIDGAVVHFVHVRSPEAGAMPLLVTHGWPGSVVEFQRVFGPLSDPRLHGGDPRDAFHVVAPSVPGFGFSGPPPDAGWNLDRITKAFAELMRRLGYDRFGAHGGDFGSLVSPELGRLFKDNVIRVHVNGLFCPTPTEPDQLATLTDDDKARLDRVNRFMRRDRGYAVLQAATPQTLAYALTDSPVGQLAWIVEKFKLWTDSAERPEDAIDRDQLLTNVMLYWLTGTAGSSARLYKETAGDLRVMSVPRSAPTGVAVFPREPLLPVRSVAELAHNIVQWSEFDRGGHFAAMEVPDLLIGDIRTFFRRFR